MWYLTKPITLIIDNFDKSQLLRIRTKCMPLRHGYFPEMSKNA